MKNLTYAFFTAVAGIILCFVMTIVTVVQDRSEKRAAESAPLTIPLPAEPTPSS